MSGVGSLVAGPARDVGNCNYLAQQGWEQSAPFPAPSEELLGATANGKLYVFAGLTELPQWHPRGYVYEYDPATNRWTKKKPMALPAHHVALLGYRGKIYAFGGFVAPPSGPSGWKPIDNSWEYDPATDSWKALALMPSKRGGGAAAGVNGEIYAIGGRIGSAFSITASLTDIVEEYDPATNIWGNVMARMPTPSSGLAWGVYKGCPVW